MKLKRILGASVLLILSRQVNAAIVTVGSLTTETDGSSIIISDSLNNREWLRWDILADLTFAQTLNETTVGAYSDFAIADQYDAAKFMTAAGGGSACIDPTNNTSVGCSRISVGSESIFGDNHEVGSDVTWFLSTDSDGSDVGSITHLTFPSGGSMGISWESFNTILDTDDYSSIGRFNDSPISWLLWRDIPDLCSEFPGGGATGGCFPGPGEFPGGGASVVPVPAAIWLFGTALIGLVGFSKRRKTNHG